MIVLSSSIDHSKNNALLFKNVLDNFIKFWPLYKQLLQFCVSKSEMRSKQVSCLLYYNNSFKETHWHDWFEGKPAGFSWNTVFTWKQNTKHTMSGKLWILWLGLWQTIFLKIKEVSEPIKPRSTNDLLSMIDLCFQVITRILKKLLSQYLKIFWWASRWH